MSMLKIIRPPSGCYAHNPFNYGPMVLYDGNTVKESRYFKPVYGVSLSTTSPAYQLKGRIWDGKLEKWGDRPCVHAYYEGKLVASTQVAMKTSSGYPEYEIGARVFTNLTFSGESDELIFLTNLKGDRFPRYETKYKTFNTGSYIGFKTIKRDILTGEILNASMQYVNVDARYKQASNFVSAAGVKSYSWYKAPPTGLQPQMFFQSLSPGTSLLVSMSEKEMFERLHVFRKPLLQPLDHLLYDDHYYYGELAKEAVDRISYFQSNGFEMIAESNTLLSQFYAWVPKGIKPGALARSYLALVYGPATTLRELSSLVSGMKRKFKTRADGYSASRSTIQVKPVTALDMQVEYHYKVVYRNWDQGLLAIFGKLESWGLSPKLGSAWDLVPMSFVFDWFFDFGDILSRVDFRATQHKVDVVGVTKSKKSIRTITLDSALTGFGGFVQLINYERIVQDKIDNPHWIGDGTDFRNYAEATALILTAIAK